MHMLTDEVLDSLSAPTYYRALDTTTLRELIDSKGRLIPEDPAPEMPRVAIPRGLRPSMQDLYDQMGSMEIRQGAIDRMAYRQELITHQDMMSSITSSIISNISSSSRMMRSSVEMTRVGWSDRKRIKEEQTRTKS
nr:hypothetical protein [Tanacetum cinerariifolium]